MGVLFINGIGNLPPFADALVFPANNAYADLSGAYEFEWQYVPQTAGNTQTAWAFRQKTTSASSYLYWNASTGAWQSTLVWNDGDAQSVTFPPGAWVDGDSYNWSAAAQDANGTGPFATDNTLTAAQAPGVTVLSPAGTCTNAEPTIVWQPILGTGVSMAAYEAIIYSEDQYTADGFAPGAGGPSVWDSGLVTSGLVTSVDLSALGTILVDNTSYRAYVQITGSGGVTSSWAFSPFTTSWVAPADPTVVISNETDSDTSAPYTAITVTGNDGDNTYDAAIAALGPVGWWKLADPVGSTTAADSSGNGLTGTVEGTVTFGEPGPIAGIPADTAMLVGTADTNYVSVADNSLLDFGEDSFTFLAWVSVASQPSSGEVNYFISKDHADSSDLGFALYNSGGNLGASINDGTTRVSAVINDGESIGIAEFVFLCGVVDRSTEEILLYVGGSQAATASISAVDSVSNTDAFYIAYQAGTPPSATIAQVAVFNYALSADQIAQLPPLITIADTSSYVGITEANVTYSDDDGTTWWPLRNGTGISLPADTQQIEIDDWEAPPGFTRLYQTQLTAEVAS